MKEQVPILNELTELQRLIQELYIRKSSEEGEDKEKDEESGKKKEEGKLETLAGIVHALEVFKSKPN